MKFRESESAVLSYMGQSGCTQECVQAIEQLLITGPRMSGALLLSSARQHAFLVTVEPGDLLVVKPGFTSGYAGEGPSGLSYVLSLLSAHGVSVRETLVEQDLMIRLERSELTRSDIALIEKAPKRPEAVWREHVSESDEVRQFENTLWKWCSSSPPMPFPLIDPRLFDLARDFFRSPDECLLRGYRRLEDALRNRTLVDDHGAGLFSSVFLPEHSPLTWKGCSATECKGRAQLFASAYMAFRNPRAHRELEPDLDAALCEFLLLNQLFRLEAEAVDRTGADGKTPSRTPAKGQSEDGRVP